MSDEYQARLDEAQAAFDAYDDELTVSLCESLRACSDERIRVEARNLHATVAFGARRYSEAAGEYRDLAKSTGRPDFAVSAVTASAMAQEYELADTFFHMAKLLMEDRIKAGHQDYAPRASVKISPPFLCLYYAFALVDSGAPERALAPIAMLRTVYAAASSTDDQTLLRQGIPAFSTFLGLVQRVPGAALN